jgi:uncharacterized protein GlcG (DUF336 family)
MTVTRQSAALWKRLTAVVTAAACSVFISCSSSNAYVPATTASTANNVLTAAEVASILTTAAASVNVPLVLAVTDRRGVVLGVYTKAGAPSTTFANFGVPAPADETAIALARTAAYFSNDQAPLSSRTVRFITQIHFPPGVANTEGNGQYGIENTNRGCPFNVTYLSGQSLPPSTLLHGGTGLGILTGKPDVMDSDATAVNPGGVPIFKNNRVAGGLGVVAAPGIANYNGVVEFAAIAGTVANGFAPIVPFPGAVVAGGITLPFVTQTTRPDGYSAGTTSGAYTYLPIDSPGPAPEGDLIQERGSTLGGLTVQQVGQIVQQSIATANTTRAVIRLPVGSRARFVITIADLDGTLLALYRMPDATIFSVDVSVAKSRNVTYWSTGSANALADLPGIPSGTAVTNRTVDFGAQPLYPEGINGTAPGPFFSLFVNDVANPCTQGSQPKNANQNGIVFFPGSVPLYYNGKLVGGLGVSGDGVDQDDYVAAGGAAGFMAPLNIRADQISIQGVRLPYQKFPENPTN